MRYCRDLPSARNELRWLKEHARDLAATRVLRNCSSATHTPPVAHKKKTKSPKTLTNFHDVEAIQNKILSRLVWQRSRGKPLQYILGTQPFGDLEIKCHEGVLIPRPETETYTEQIGKILSDRILDVKNDLANKICQRKRIRILDLCTGTGCIALLLHSLLKPPPGTMAPSSVLSKTELGIEVVGLDISDRAVELARLNLKHNVEKRLLHPDARKDIHFATRDIREIDVVPGKTSLETVARGDRETRVYLNPELENQSLIDGSWDVVISNPPYISSKELTGPGSVEKSVRKYEPRLALVPPDDDDCGPQDRSSPDLFYRLLVKVTRKVDASLLVMEVGDSEQANRILRLAHRELSHGANEALFESWRDNGSVRQNNHLGGLGHDPEKRTVASEEGISDRVVVYWRGDWARWRRDTSTPPIAKNNQPAMCGPEKIKIDASRQGITPLANQATH
ncbi:uncharacterized protein A1O9_02264 [Exophiala aquamarina CBS 119918]|uniref:Type II methyltransferase M.TaqI-like domain-containing protein n=1 Tax=Exophiala aquamarina CBS 119918 TaxID=1182545 RepID=A0A072PMZ4_9EURO|nr:uncharacterized protein A1O9_02264 [Exophiala aquamarina CBS 119918]KEF60703.1 hypothetical protein A1O9_02264 [Exophiala aquamarina CBS 119918]